MIRSAKRMHKFEIVASGGRIGAIDDFLFDDERWAREAQSYLSEEPEPRFERTV